MSDGRDARGAYYVVDRQRHAIGGVAGHRSWQMRRYGDAPGSAGGYYLGTYIVCECEWAARHEHGINPIAKHAAHVDLARLGVK